VQLETALAAIQVLGIDIANLTPNLAITKAQLDAVTEAAHQIDPRVWESRMIGEGENTTHETVIPPYQQDAILKLLVLLG
jgi:hypothetical protein